MKITKETADHLVNSALNLIDLIEIGAYQLERILHALWKHEPFNKHEGYQAPFV